MSIANIAEILLEEQRIKLMLAEEKNTTIKQNIGTLPTVKSTTYYPAFTKLIIALDTN